MPTHDYTRRRFFGLLGGLAAIAAGLQPATSGAEIRNLIAEFFLSSGEAP